MDKTIYKEVREYAELVRSQLDVKMIVLFGSYANGKQKKYSDIDVAVIVDKIKGRPVSKLIQVMLPLPKWASPTYNNDDEGKMLSNLYFTDAFFPAEIMSTAGASFKSDGV